MSEFREKDSIARNRKANLRKRIKNSYSNLSEYEGGNDLIYTIAVFIISRLHHCINKRTFRSDFMCYFFCRWLVLQKTEEQLFLY